ncbi:hypothetical protein A3Q35_13200 [Aeribacillus pallidus]|uniref:phage structural protein n=1 Tax=Aeribacillus pallidus TaxID=33936 RepID=UPI0007B491D2|nr:hypothetical protein [Aeribacillus pallidus]KZM54910.1 hypothetical protein A3Q35_13200 [Aeribacillus pallidus]
MADGVYDASKVTVTAKNMNVTGFKKGTFVTANKDDELVTAESNAQGETTWTVNNSKLGTITITLNQTSPFCKFFNNLAKSRELFPIWVNDPSTREKRGGTKAMVTKQADATFSDGVEGRQYTIKVGDFDVINY